MVGFKLLLASTWLLLADTNRVWPANIVSVSSGRSGSVFQNRPPSSPDGSFWAATRAYCAFSLRFMRMG